MNLENIRSICMLSFGLSSSPILSLLSLLSFISLISVSPFSSIFRFAAFEPSPIAAASIAQVHRAVLPDGTECAVKVQYPEIQEMVRFFAFRFPLSALRSLLFDDRSPFVARCSLSVLSIYSPIYSPIFVAIIPKF
jgi:hypothetical protein